MLHTLGQYKVLSKIAQGGMAEVFKAEKLGLDDCNKLVAIKKIIAPPADSKEYQEYKSMLYAEARIVQHLEHPNIVQFYDYFEHNHQPYIAFQFVEGLNLTEILRYQKQSIPYEVFLYIISEVLNGLDYAHKKTHNDQNLNIVHRDVSPQNILISYDGIVKLSDFGIAKANVKRDQTEAHVIKGKLNYFAPEQVRFEQLTHKSDLYAVGVVLYEYLYGTNPYEIKGDQNKVLYDIAQGNRKIKQKPIVNAPKELISIIEKAIANDPKDRFDDAKEFRGALTTIQDSKWLSEGSYLLKDYLAPLKGLKNKENKTKKLNNQQLNQETRLSSSLTNNKAGVTWLKRPLIYFGVFILTVSASLWFSNYRSVKPSEKIKTEKKLNLKKPDLAHSVDVQNNYTKNITEKKSEPEISIQRAKQSVQLKKKINLEDKKQVYGSINVQGPLGSSVFINGQDLGKVPLKKNLKEGSYLIAISPEKGEPHITRVNVVSRKEFVVRWSK